MRDICTESEVLILGQQLPLKRNFEKIQENTEKQVTCKPALSFCQLLLIFGVHVEFEMHRTAAGN